MSNPPSSDEVDYYTLLSISPSSTIQEIRRAYRRTSLLYHPDKVANPTPATTQKFQELQTALAILTDETERAKYDSKREARLRKAEEERRMGEKRRKMVGDLEAREKGTNGGMASVNGMKRTWTERELEVKRIQEENRRRMAEASMRRQKEAAEAAKTMEERRKADEVETVVREDAHNEDSPVTRSVKVRWVKEGEGLEVDEEWLEGSFAVGDVENVLIMKDKKRKHDGKKQVLGNAMLVFASRQAAEKAVKQGKWDVIESVDWLGKSKEGDAG